MVDSRISCLVLAAGSSQRFGSPKMMARLNDGRTMLETTIEIYQQVFDKVWVVSRDEYAQNISQQGGTFVPSPQTSQGMSQSLIAGVQACRSSRAWLIALADMPYIEIKTIKHLVSRAAGNRIVVPSCASKRGNPVILGQQFQNEIMALTGDVGAKSVCKNNPLSLDVVPVSDQGIFHDVDTPSAILS
jgi:molybdenum cofactor cytidylyltransferase